MKAIYIPSYKRSSSSTTYETIRGTPWEEHTFFVVYEHELAAYKRTFPAAKFVVCDFEPNIGLKRATAIRHAIENNFNRVVHLDDDIAFNRVLLVGGKAKTGRVLKIDELLADVFEALKRNAFVGIGKLDAFLLMKAVKTKLVDEVNGKCFRVLGMRTDILQQHNINFWNLLAEDYELQLHLLQHGYTTLQLSRWCHSPGSTPKKQEGTGCLAYRTQERQEASVFRLKEMYPEGVHLREFATNGFKRIDAELRLKQYAKALHLSPAVVPTVE